MNFVVKFDGTSCNLSSCGYSGTNDRVTAALNQIFAPEITVAGLTLPGMEFANMAHTGGAPSVVAALSQKGAGTSR